MISIPKSAIGPAFEAAVAAHAAELKQWRAHMQRVTDDEKNGVVGIDKHAPYPRPAAPPLVESCVDENGVASYQIIDDGPTAEQILAKKKAELFMQVALAEQAAIAAVVPAGKRRLFNLREASIGAADSERRLKILNDSSSGPIKSVLRMIRGAPAVDPEKLELAVAKDRPAADTAHLQEQADRSRRIQAIELLAAQAHHDIEDLTLDTIATWQAPNFD